MKTINSHHDGHGLNESIEIRATDEIGPGGAHHAYSFDLIEDDENLGENLAYIQFRKGPRNEPGSTPGVTTEAILAMLSDHLEEFQAGPFPSPQTAESIAQLKAAKAAQDQRAHERADRGVLRYSIK